MIQQAPAPSGLACSQCGRLFAHSDLVQIAGNWVCGGCKPAFLSRVMASGASATTQWHYGGFWIRFAARFIDSIVLFVPILIIAAVLMPSLLRTMRQMGNTQGAPNLAFTGVFLTFFLFIFLAGMAYEVVLLKYHGATVGKMACGVKVVRSDSRSLGWGVSFGRFFMWNVLTSGIPYLNSILILISGIMAGVDSEKRAIHDRVCDTRVVYKQSLARA